MRVHLALSSLLIAGVLSGETRRIGFDGDTPGEPPAAFTAARTGRGAEGAWVVVAAPGAPSPPNAVKQASTDDTSYRFPVLLAPLAETVNGTLSVRFQTISGRVDRAAGLVWRYLDENNYYVVRANALEDNVVLYKVEAGERSSLAPRGAPKGTYGVDCEVPDGDWNRLDVRFEGPRFTLSFNGEALFEVEDHTFTGPGRVGLWTKSDSVTLFDDLTVESEE